MLLSGFRPCRYYYRRGQCPHRLSPDWARYRARCVVCVSTSSLSSLVIDVFDTLPRSHAMCGLRSHVIAVITCYCRVSGPVITTIAVGNVYPVGRVRPSTLWSLLWQGDAAAVLWKSCIMFVRTCCYGFAVFGDQKLLLLHRTTQPFFGTGVCASGLNPVCALNQVLN